VESTLDASLESGLTSTLLKLTVNGFTAGGAASSANWRRRAC
jgi:hypothetical protein